MTTRIDTRAGGQAPGNKTSTRGRLNGRELQAHRRSDTRGSRAGYRKGPPEPPESASGLWDIAAWCREARISKTKYYGLKAAGTGPREVTIGCSKRILESPREYAERLAKEQAQGGES